MKNLRLLLWSLILLLQTSVFTQDLPRHLTEEEKVLMTSYQPPVDDIGATIPPEKAVRTMAEWEELEGIMLTWTSYQTILRQIVDIAQEEGLVYIVCSDSNSVKNYLTSGSVPLRNLKFIIAPYNSVWSRDYGPWCVYSDIADSMYIIDWIYNRPRPNDDLIPGVIAGYLDLPIYQTTVTPYNLVHTGGNFIADGNGIGFSSKLVLTENSGKPESQINSIMSAFMGIDPYVKMDELPYDGIHHIDMHMKLLDEETLLVGQYPPGIADGPYIENNLQYVLNNFQTIFGRPFKIVRIPMPPDQYGRYPSNGGYYRTFTNSLIVNKTVIVPTYELKYDTTALRIYRDAMPGYNVVGIDCNQIIPASGAIHCITKEIGVREPIFISHAKILTVNPGESGYPVKAFIKTRSGISSASVYWRLSGDEFYSKIQMQMTSPDTFTAVIPMQNVGTDIYYYIEAVSVSGRTALKPMTSPEGAYRFTVDYAVPVELVSFDYHSSNGGISLQWATATELNNEGFSIERRSAGTNNKWVEISWIEGAGTSSEIRNYASFDINPDFGRNYYRLIQHDFDGYQKEIGLLEADFRNNDLEFHLAQNYPNPFNPSTTIKFSLKQEGHVTLKVYDILGRLTATLIDEFMTSGNHKFQFNSANLSAGVYSYHISSGEFSDSKSMILLK